jgi:hypothetical protein
MQFVRLNRHLLGVGVRECCAREAIRVLTDVELLAELRTAK